MRKQKRQTHPRSKLRQIYFAMRQLCEGPKMLQLRRPLVGRTSYCMPVPLEDARSFLGFSVKATQRICLSYMLLKNNSNRRKYEFVRNWPRYHFWPCQDAHSGKRWLPLPIGQWMSSVKIAHVDFPVHSDNECPLRKLLIWVVEIRSPTPAFPKMWLELTQYNF